MKREVKWETKVRRIAQREYVLAIDKAKRIYRGRLDSINIVIKLKKDIQEQEGTK